MNIMNKISKTDLYCIMCLKVTNMIHITHKIDGKINFCFSCIKCNL